MLTWGGRGVPARPARAGTLRRLLLAAGLAALLTLTGAPARAADPGGSCPPEQTDCDVWDDDPGIPGGPGGPGGGGDNGGGGGNGGGTPKCQWNGRAIPCYHEVLGWFNNADGCYYKLEEPQGEAPPGQQWYQLTCNGGDLGSIRRALLDAPPAGYGAPPDPEELARRALASISLLPPRAAVAPRRSQGPGLVGLPVWMWASPGASYFGPLSASASDRGLTVEITAKVDRIVWHMSDDIEVTCDGPGTPYRADGPRAGSTSPDCGLDQGYPAAGTYEVSATTFWTVEWSGGGESGVIAQSRSSGVVLVQINELQVVTR
ncbi:MULTISPECIES: hypothetical protein [unclassified Micromonospora]|uniref:hypothetical protein n=1 Tax=unclassified Micromonospora TaxID=2617518 RepID=UPI001C2173D2|nr:MULTISPECIES: hypothetical protein [unclassified Micromonospora]MBU8858254.1 hypothetical protein [Micromonospora sp. WMMB482]MDM4783897.1 hypothetical protein [Micromonospora sp. b486]